MTFLYAFICAAIAARIITFDRKGGEFLRLPAVIAWVLTVAAGSVPIRAALGVMPAPDPASLVLAAVVFVVLLKTRGSVYHIMPRRGKAIASARSIHRRAQP